MLNSIATFKKLFFAGTVCVITLSLGCFALKSTDFQRTYIGNKIIISMNPVYSEGDPLPPLASEIMPEPTSEPTRVAYNNAPIYKPKAIKPLQKMFYKKQIATAQPLSIIPNHVPSKKSFFNHRVIAVNSYLKNKPNAYTHGSTTFSGKIPSHGTKYLKPISVSQINNNQHHTPQVYNQYVSIER
jgi:hypothetical protein